MGNFSELLYTNKNYYFKRLITGIFEYLCTDNKIHVMNETIILKKFADIDLNDSFLKGLKEDYPEFEA